MTTGEKLFGVLLVGTALIAVVYYERKKRVVVVSHPNSGSVSTIYNTPTGEVTTTQDSGGVDVPTNYVPLQPEIQGVMSAIATDNGYGSYAAYSRAYSDKHAVERGYINFADYLAQHSGAMSYLSDPGFYPPPDKTVISLELLSQAHQHGFDTYSDYVSAINNSTAHTLGYPDWNTLVKNNPGYGS